MINIIRGEIPKSLQSPQIQEYINQVIEYQSLSVEEQTKTPPPKCTIDYRSEDLFEAFDRDFFAKCYLTEKRYENSWAMDVEHFKAKAFAQHPELKYEWTNLYPADHDANMLKPRKEAEGGYLDPCAQEDDVEKEILYTALFGGETAFKARDSKNLKAVNTAQLLDKIHNGSDEASKKKTATLRQLIAKKEHDILNTIIEWQGASGEQDKFDAETRLKKLLSRRSSFTMLMRSLKAVRRHIPPDFLD